MLWLGERRMCLLEEELYISRRAGGFGGRMVCSRLLE